MNKLITAYQTYLVSVIGWFFILYVVTPGWSWIKTVILLFVAVFFGAAPLLRTLDYFTSRKEKTDGSK